MSDLDIESTESVDECTKRLRRALDWFDGEIESCTPIAADGTTWAYAIRSSAAFGPWVVGVSLFDFGERRVFRLAADGYGGFWGGMLRSFDRANTPKLSKSIKRMQQIGHLLNGGSLSWTGSMT